LANVLLVCGPASWPLPLPISKWSGRGHGGPVQEAGDITVPGRKFLDILRALPEKVPVALALEGEKVVLKAGRSRFSCDAARRGISGDR